MVNGLTPSYLTNLIPFSHDKNHRYRTRNNSHFVQPIENITIISFSPPLDGVSLPLFKKISSQILKKKISFVQDLGTIRSYMSNYA